EEGSPTVRPGEIIRATKEEKENQIQTVQKVQAAYAEDSQRSLEQLKNTAVKHLNIFDALMEASKYNTLGQITNAMFEVGGQYRRNM
ncbi:MAG: hypothetical protein K9I68_12165, partial [Bacteroidales bacterium]|nr:hypothetical protein [Bacteroidales bacterium]